MDIFSPAQRHHIMGRIQAKNTNPELIVRSFLFRNGFRFRIHCRNLPGTPDVVLKKYKTIIDVRGCFWHSHSGCKAATIPASNMPYWMAKLNRNVERDIQNEIEVKKLGWNLIVVWECETTKNNFPPKNLLDFVRLHRKGRSDASL